MTLLTTLQREFGWETEYALACSLARAFAFYAAITAAYGGELRGPTYEELEQIAELERERAAGEEGGKLGWAP